MWPQKTHSQRKFPHKCTHKHISRTPQRLLALTMSMIRCPHALHLSADCWKPEYCNKKKTLVISLKCIFNSPREINVLFEEHGLCHIWFHNIAAVSFFLLQDFIHVDLLCFRGCHVNRCLNQSPNSASTRKSQSNKRTAEKSGVKDVQIKVCI